MEIEYTDYKLCGDADLTEHTGLIYCDCSLDGTWEYRQNGDVVGTGEEDCKKLYKARQSTLGKLIWKN